MTVRREGVAAPPARGRCDRLRPHRSTSSFRPVRASPLALLTTLALAGCNSGSGSNPVRESFAAAAQRTGLEPAIAFRFPESRSGDVGLYRLPSLDAITWRFESTRRGTRAIVGLSGDREVLYAITTGDELIGLDLPTGRLRTVDSSVAAAVLSPTGTPLVIHDDGSVAAVELRSVVPWSNGFAAPPAQAWAGARDRLLAVVETDSSRSFVLAANGQSPVWQPIPSGRVSVSPWGDLALVTTDSGIAYLDPTDPEALRFDRVEPPPVFTAFSASGHRIYVGRADGVLEAIDRFAQGTVGKLQLPGAPADARQDPWGRYLLVRAAEGNEVWIVDLVDWKVAGALETSWEPDLPAVAPDGIVLSRSGGRVESRTPGAAEAEGRVSSRQADRWAVVAWDPSRPTLDAEAGGGPAEAARPGELIYVQVSSTSSPEWAADLAADLRRAGMAAAVLPPELPTDPYRVVLGPYATRDEAEATGRQLKLPYWIFTRDTTSTRP
jgi:cell division septation protein DedD